MRQKRAATRERGPSCTIVAVQCGAQDARLPLPRRPGRTGNGSRFWNTQNGLIPGTGAHKIAGQTRGVEVREPPTTYWYQCSYDPEEGAAAASQTSRRRF